MFYQYSLYTSPLESWNLKHHVFVQLGVLVYGQLEMSCHVC